MFLISSPNHFSCVWLHLSFSLSRFFFSCWNFTFCQQVQKIFLFICLNSFEWDPRSIKSDGPGRHTSTPFHSKRFASDFTSQRGESLFSQRAGQKTVFHVSIQVSSSSWQISTLEHLVNVAAEPQENTCWETNYLTLLIYYMLHEAGHSFAIFASKLR